MIVEIHEGFIDVIVFVVRKIVYFFVLCHGLESLRHRHYIFSILWVS